MDTLDLLLEIVGASVVKHGSIPLSTGHLLNILRMAERRSEQIERELDRIGPDED